MPPLVSILTRTLDRPRLLPRACESVLGQTFQDWEHLIINDGGDADALEAVVAPYLELYGGRLRVLHRRGGEGMEAASNDGIRHARGSWISIHDDDDRWAPRFLEACLEAAEAADEATLGGVAAGVRRVLERWDGREFSPLEVAPHGSVERHQRLWRMAEENAFPPIALLIRRAAGEAVGWFDASLPVLGDWEFHLRLLLAFEILGVPEELAFYHLRPPTETSAEANTVGARDALHRATAKALCERWAASPDPRWRAVAEIHREGAERLRTERETIALAAASNRLRDEVRALQYANRS